MHSSESITLDDRLRLTLSARKLVIGGRTKQTNSVTDSPKNNFCLLRSISVGYKLALYESRKSVLSQNDKRRNHARKNILKKTVFEKLQTILIVPEKRV